MYSYDYHSIDLGKVQLHFGLLGCDGIFSLHQLKISRMDTAYQQHEACIFYSHQFTPGYLIAKNTLRTHCSVAWKKSLNSFFAMFFCFCHDICFGRCSFFPYRFISLPEFMGFGPMGFNPGNPWGLPQKKKPRLPVKGLFLGMLVGFITS